MKPTDRLLLGLVPPLGAALIRLAGLTMRLEKVNAPPWKGLENDREGVIFAFWHNRLFLMPLASRGREVAVLISRHRDGELISRTMSHFGFLSVRGSTTRGGGDALRRLPRILREGKDVAITPDGPRGPVYRVQPGVVQLARLSGRPIVPVTFASDRFRRFRSWDGFQVPKLFARGVFLFGEPMEVRRRDDIEEKRAELEERLVELTRRADGWFGKGSGLEAEE